MTQPTVNVHSAEPVFAKRLVKCRCGAWRDEEVPEKWHAPHHAVVGGQLRIINCSGEVLA